MVWHEKERTMKLNQYVVLVLVSLGVACSSGDEVFVEEVATTTDLSPGTDVKDDNHADVRQDIAPTADISDTTPVDTLADTKPTDILPDQPDPEDVMSDSEPPQDLPPDTPCIPADEACNGLDDDCDGEVDEPTTVHGAPLVLCDDSNTCTTDACDSVEGCVFIDNADACDDGDPCTGGDICQAGACAGAPLPPGQVNIDECICETDADCQPYNDGSPCSGTLECIGATGTCGVVPGSAINCDEFSIILIPDTQYYTCKLPDSFDNTYYKQMQWIVDWQDAFGIEFAIHLGDITHHNVDSEWDIADNAHSILDAAGVPYSVVPGNHDYYPSSTFSRSQTKFNDYFGSDRFQGETWYGGSYGSGNENNYTFFEIGQMEFMVLSVEHAPRKDILCWANDLISSHPSRRVIIVTHCYLTHDGAYNMGCAGGYDIPGGSGLTVWDELASRQPLHRTRTSSQQQPSSGIPSQTSRQSPATQVSPPGQAPQEPGLRVLG